MEVLADDLTSPFRELIVNRAVILLISVELAEVHWLD